MRPARRANFDKYIEKNDISNGEMAIFFQDSVANGQFFRHSVRIKWFWMVNFMKIFLIIVSGISAVALTVFLVVSLLAVTPSRECRVEVEGAKIAGSIARNVGELHRARPGRSAEFIEGAAVNSHPVSLVRDRSAGGCVYDLVAEYEVIHPNGTVYPLRMTGRGKCTLGGCFAMNWDTKGDSARKSREGR